MSQSDIAQPNDQSTPAPEATQAEKGALSKWVDELRNYFRPGQSVTADTHAQTPEEQQAMIAAQGGNGGFVLPDPVTIQTKDQAVQAIKDRADSIATATIPGYGLVSGLINEASSASKQPATTDGTTAEEQQAVIAAQGGNGGFVLADPVTIQTGEQAKEAIENRLKEITGAITLAAAGAGVAEKVTAQATSDAVEAGTTAARTAEQTIETMPGSVAPQAETTTAHAVGSEGAPKDVLPSEQAPQTTPGEAKSPDVPLPEVNPEEVDRQRLDLTIDKLNYGQQLIEPTVSDKIITGQSWLRDFQNARRADRETLNIDPDSGIVVRHKEHYGDYIEHTSRGNIAITTGRDGADGGIIYGTPKQSDTPTSLQVNPKPTTKMFKADSHDGGLDLGLEDHTGIEPKGSPDFGIPESYNLSPELQGVLPKEGQHPWRILLDQQGRITAWEFKEPIYVDGKPVVSVRMGRDEGMPTYYDLEGSSKPLSQWW